EMRSLNASPRVEATNVEDDELVLRLARTQLLVQPSERNQRLDFIQIAFERQQISLPLLLDRVSAEHEDDPVLGSRRVEKPTDRPLDDTLERDSPGRRFLRHNHPRRALLARLLLGLDTVADEAAVGEVVVLVLGHPPTLPEPIEHDVVASLPVVKRVGKEVVLDADGQHTPREDAGGR